MGRAGKLVAAAVAAVLAVLAVQLVLPRIGEERDPTTRARAPQGFPTGVAFGDTLRRLPADDLRDALDEVVALGANWIRVDLSWAAVQPDSADASDWAGLDRVVAAARDRDLKVLGILTYTPAWARTPGCSGFACPPRSATEFATFAQAAAARYRGRVAAYEVWNEPNLDRFWRSPDPTAYGALLAATVPALRRGDRAATVLVGGLAANAAGSQVVAAPQFLARACAGTACADVDAVAYHPYTFPLTAEDRSPSVTAWQRITERSSWGPGLAELVGRALPGRGRIWITEYGAPTGGASGVSEEQQAAIVASGVRAARSTSAVGAIFVYAWKDLGDGPDPEDHFGLLRADGSRKPSFRAFADAAGS